MASPLQQGAFNPPTRGGAPRTPFGQGNTAMPTSYGSIEGMPEAPRVWRNAPTSLKSPPKSPYTAPLLEPEEVPTRLSTAAPYICEFVGTFMLVFTAAMCDFTLVKEWASGATVKLWAMGAAPTAVGCVLVVIIYAVGFVSGGHLNPAISLAVFLARKMSFLQFLGYVIVQLLAGLFAGCVFEVAFQSHASMIMPAAPFNFFQAAIIEVVFTAMLCFVWLSVSKSVRNNPENDRNQFFALAIGFAVIAAGYAGGNISGAVLNPSLALGLDLSGWWRAGGIKWGFLYAGVELLGAALGAIIFRLCRGEDYLQQRLSYDGHYIDDVATYVPSLRVRMFSEFVGTFFLVLTFGLNVMMMSTATAWSVSAALLCLIYSLANVSGGHFNPAVTAAVVMSGRNKCSVKDGMFYALVQCLGGVVAAILMGYIHHTGPTAHVQFGVFASTSSYSWSAIATVEIIFTFLLTYVVLSVATSDEYAVSTTRSRQNFYFALAIGFAMCAGCIASGQVSGGYLNPAVALGFAAESLPNVAAEAKTKGWPGFGDDILKVLSIIGAFFAHFGSFGLYFLFELAGAALAACIFRLTHPAEYQKRMPHLISYVETRDQ